MQTNSLHANYSHPISGIKKVSLYTRFITWCEGEQYNRLFWLAFALVAHGCAITPLTGMAVVFTGNSPLLFSLVTISMVGVLLVNLAAMPTKITIPVFLLSIVIDICILATCAYTALAG